MNLSFFLKTLLETGFIFFPYFKKKPPLSILIF